MRTTHWTTLKKEKKLLRSRILLLSLTSRHSSTAGCDSRQRLLHPPARAHTSAHAYHPWVKSTQCPGNPWTRAVPRSPVSRARTPNNQHISPNTRVHTRARTHTPRPFSTATSSALTFEDARAEAVKDEDQLLLDHHILSRLTWQFPVDTPLGCSRCLWLS